MSVSKRTRYEVLRRDGNRCRYCGASAEESPLTIDHVVPVSLGGSDDPSNLVAACRDCNTGKASSNPDADAVAQVADDAIRWAAALEKAAENYAAERKRLEADLGRFEHEWSGWRVGQSKVPIDDAWRSSLTAMRAAGLPLDEAIALVRVAMESKATLPNKFRYFCGCAWTAIRQLQDEARKYVGCEELPVAAAEPRTVRCGHCFNCIYVPDEDCSVMSVGASDSEDYEPCPECGERQCLYGIGYASGVERGDYDICGAISGLRDILLNISDDARYKANDAAIRFLDAGAELYELGYPLDSAGIFPHPADDIDRVARIMMGPERHTVPYCLSPDERAEKSVPF